MKKNIVLAIFALALCLAFGALADTRIVDNGDSEKAVPERLNLRVSPAANADVLGSYYSGAEVTLLEDEDAEDEYAPVSIGGLTGYMAERYLVTREALAAQYGSADALSGRAAEVELTGLWQTEEPVYEAASADSVRLGALQSGTAVRVYGIVGSWAYAGAEIDGQPILGYIRSLALCEAGDAKAAIVMGSDAAGAVPLYNAAVGKQQEVLSVRNGAAAFLLFGRSGGNWYRVRIGGVAGWVRNAPSENLVFLGGAPRSSVPYYPPLMQTARDTILYVEPGNLEAQYMTLGEGMKLEVLGTQGDYAYIRTLEGSVGAMDSGDFGFVKAEDLAAAAQSYSVGVAQADDGDLPVLLTNTPDGGRVIGALVPGAQVRIANYTQTDSVQLSLGGMTAYAPKKSLRLLTEGNGEPSDRIPQRAVAREEAALYSEPADGADQSGVIPAGSRVYMLAKCGEWAFVNAAGNATLSLTNQTEDVLGFVKLTSLNAPAGTTHLTAMVTTDKVNMRESADRSSPIVDKARLGELLRVADYGSKWTCVVRENGSRGYVMTEYLKFD